VQGPNNGLPVAFTIVAVDSSQVPPGLFSITLSDGDSNSGNLARREHYCLLAVTPHNRRGTDAQSVSQLS